VAYQILFADETEPTLVTRNRKPMDPDKRAFIAPWELRVGNLRGTMRSRTNPCRGS
jgi:hypothetical protein